MWPLSEWWQLLEGLLLAPLGQRNLSAPWSSRVYCSDACPGGHGLAYTSVSKAEQQRWTRYCSFRGDYSTLKVVDDLYVGPDVFPPRVANLPLKDYCWHEVSRLGGCRHISLEELRAGNWSIEHRLHSRDDNCRCIHGGDHTTHVGAAVKGRISSRLVHAHCRRRMAICLPSGLFPFDFYLRSADNPADRPGRATIPKTIFNPLLVIVHLFSGLRRPGDFQDQVERFGGIHNSPALVLSFDVANSGQRNV